MKQAVSVVIPTWNRKNKLLALLGSVFSSSYFPLEVIVVDNASTDGTAEAVKKKFPKVKIIKNAQNLGAASARNIGIEKAKGKYLFLIDDDNIITPEAIQELVSLMEAHPDFGLVGPKMVYKSNPHIIWFAGVSLNYLTSQTRYRGFGKKDNGEFDRIQPTDHVPNAMFVRQEVFKKGARFDPFYRMTYEEPDFAASVRAAGYQVVYYPGVTVKHDIAPEPRGTLRAKLGFDAPARVYDIGRNRFIFMRRFAPGINFWIFLFVFSPLFALYYLANFIGYGRVDLIIPYLRGVFDGLKLAVFKKK